MSFRHVGAGAAFLVAGAFITSAEAAPVAGGVGTKALIDPSAMVHKSQVIVFRGRRWCYYWDAWNGPGWYWCGYDWRRGYGWGGGPGWHGWRYHSRDWHRRNRGWDRADRRDRDRGERRSDRRRDSDRGDRRSEGRRDSEVRGWSSDGRGSERRSFDGGRRGGGESMGRGGGGGDRGMSRGGGGGGGRGGDGGGRGRR